MCKAKLENPTYQSTAFFQEGYRFSHSGLIVMKTCKHAFPIMVFLVGMFYFYQAWAHDQPSRGRLLPKLYTAPEFTGLTHWINSSDIRSMDKLKGKVVLIDFWTFGCINCIRTLPHIQKWHETYKDSGLVVLGIHAPEFAYERKPKNVIAAVKRFGLTYPV